MADMLSALDQINDPENLLTQVRGYIADMRTAHRAQCSFVENRNHQKVMSRLRRSGTKRAREAEKFWAELARMAQASGAGTEESSDGTIPPPADEPKSKEQ